MTCWRLRYAGIGAWPDTYFANEFITMDYPIEENFFEMNLCPFENVFRREVEERLPAGWDILSLRLASESIWNFYARMRKGDILLCRDRKNLYHVGELGDYEYAANAAMPHRRSINWKSGLIPSSCMTYDLRRACESSSILKDLSRFQDEISGLLRDASFNTAAARNSVNADRLFLDLLLEQFVEENWRQTVFFPEYELCSPDLCPPVLRGMADLLAISQDGQKYLALEIKKCRDDCDLLNSLLQRIALARRELNPLGMRISGAILTTEKNARLCEIAAASTDVQLHVFDLDFRLRVKSMD